jgi:hypothetical protein
VRFTQVTPATLRAQAVLAQGDVKGARQLVAAEVTRLRSDRKAIERLRASASMAAARIAAVDGDLPSANAHAADAVDRYSRSARDPEASAYVGAALLLQAQLQQQGGRHAEAAVTARRAQISLRNALGAGHALTRAAQLLTGN